MISPYSAVITIFFLCNLVTCQVIVPQIIKGLNSSNDIETICVCFPVMCFTRKLSSDKIIVTDEYTTESTKSLEFTESATKIEVNFPTINTKESSEVSTFDSDRNTETEKTELTIFTDSTEVSNLFTTESTPQKTIFEETSKILEESTSEINKNTEEQSTVDRSSTDIYVFQTPTTVLEATGSSNFNDFTTETTFESTLTSENVKIEDLSTVSSFKSTCISPKIPNEKKLPVIVCYVVTDDPSNFSYFQGSDKIPGEKSQDGNSKILDLGISKVVANKSMVFPGLNTSNLIESLNSSSELPNSGQHSILSSELPNFGQALNPSTELPNSGEALKSSSISPNSGETPNSITSIGSSTIGPVSLDVIKIIQNNSLSLIEKVSQPTMTTINEPRLDRKSLIENKTSTSLKNEQQAVKDLRLEFLNYVRKQILTQANNSSNRGGNSTIGWKILDELNIMQNKSSNLSEKSTGIPTVRPIYLDELNFIPNLTTENSTGSSLIGSKNSYKSTINGAKTLEILNSIQNLNSTSQERSNIESNSFDISNLINNSFPNDLLEKQAINSISKHVLNMTHNQNLFPTGNQMKPFTSKPVDSKNNVHLIQNQNKAPSSIVTEISDIKTSSVDGIRMDKLKMLRNEIINKKKTFDGIIDLIEALNETTAQRNQEFDGGLLPLKRREFENFFGRLDG